MNQEPQHPIFHREDLSKPENRINVAIFGLLAVREFRVWMLDRLGLSSSTVLFPSQDPGEQRRPDFRIVDGLTGEHVGWLEVEIGEDSGQLDDYRIAYAPLRVAAIWGRPHPEADLSLEQIAKFLDSLDSHEDIQVRYNAAHLREQISAALAGRIGNSYKRAPVSETMLKSPFLTALRQLLPEINVTAVSGPLVPGEIRLDTNKERGFSLRVFSSISTTKRSVALTSLSGGRPFVLFPNYEELTHYLPGREHQVKNLAELVNRMGADMNASKKPERTVPLSVAEAHLKELAHVIRSLSSPPQGGS